MEHQGITPWLVVAMEKEESRHGNPKVLLLWRGTLSGYHIFEDIFISHNFFKFPKPFKVFTYETN